MQYAHRHNQFQDLHIGLNQSSPPPYPPGYLKDSESKESAIEPVTELLLASRTVNNPVQEPSITLEAAPTSTITTNVEDSSPPFKLESESPNVSITSPIQSQEQNRPSYVLVANEVNVASLAKKKESMHIAELDDDIKAMSHEFDEGFRDNLKNVPDITCGRCDTKTAATNHHYNCPECEYMKLVCQKCYYESENCGIHHKKFFRVKLKPWNTLFSMLHVDSKVTTEDNELIRALKQNNTTRIKQYAQNRSLLDSQDRLGYTPLHVASQLGLEEGAALLIECGALFKTRNSILHTPLHTAVYANQIKIVQILLDGGANVEVKFGKEGVKPLHMAAANVMHHIATLLLRKGAEIDAPSDYGTPLCVAIRQPQCCKCVEALLVAGANVNYRGGDNLETPLIVACAIDDHETARIVVDLLLLYGAVVDLTNNDGYTPLMMAADMGHLGACKSLLARSPQLDIKTPKFLSENAMYFAVKKGHEEILDLLIEKGASCVPPKAVGARMNPFFKWNRFVFEPHVTPESKKRILSKLRVAQKKQAYGQFS